jgi:hypothetical protein
MRKENTSQKQDTHNPRVITGRHGKQQDFMTVKKQKKI